MTTGSIQGATPPGTKPSSGCGLLTLLLGLFVTCSVARTCDSPPSVRPASVSTAPAEAKIALAALPHAPLGMHVLAVPPPIGMERWDAVAGLPSVLPMARAWSAEATLTRIEIVGASGQTGLIDLTIKDRPAVVTYHFWPSTRESALAAPRFDVEAQTASGKAISAGRGLTIRLMQSGISAFVSELTPPPSADIVQARRNAPAVDSQPLADLVGLLRTRGELDRAASYDGTFTYDASAGWQWELRAGDDGSPLRVQARDGRAIASGPPPRRVK